MMKQPKICRCGQIADYEYKNKYYCFECAGLYIIDHLDDFVYIEDLINKKMVTL